MNKSAPVSPPLDIGKPNIIDKGPVFPDGIDKVDPPVVLLGKDEEGVGFGINPDDERGIIKPGWDKVTTDIGKVTPVPIGDERVVIKPGI